MEWKRGIEMKHLIIVRGGGELATGVIHCLHRAGFRVLALEKALPTATRRRVAFSDAMYRGKMTVERVTCYKAESLEEAKKRLKNGDVVMLDDPAGKCIEKLSPAVVIDAITGKHNYGTNRAMAPHTIALGAGFCAGRDVDTVVEIARGHNLGRLIYEGYSAKDDRSNGYVGVDRNIEHLVFAPVGGTVDVLRTISQFVKKGESIAHIHGEDGSIVEIRATIDGVLRGAVHSGSEAEKGQRIADIHPTMGQEECFTISDKARCIGGSVLEDVMAWWHASHHRRGFLSRL